jgi:putative oxidoreductase
MNTKPQLYFPALQPLYDRVAEYGVPLIRVAAGLILVPHGMQKIFGMWGGNINGTAAFFSKFGIEPALPLAYLVGFTELIGGLLLALGLFTRVAAVAIFVMLTVAWYKVHLVNGFFWTRPGGGIEYALLWSLVALGFAFAGGGKYSLDAKLGKEI